jgi:hypothetical protein
VAFTGESEFQLQPFQARVGEQNLAERSGPQEGVVEVRLQAERSPADRGKRGCPNCAAPGAFCSCVEQIEETVLKRIAPPDEIAAIFSKEAVLRGSFDRYAREAKGKRGTTGVDEDFLTQMEVWRDLLAKTLRDRGAEVEFAECYRRVNPNRNAGKLEALWQNGHLQAIVVTSSEALRNLLALAGREAAWLKAMPLFVNHPRIAKAAGEHGLHAIAATAAGDAGMLETLINWRTKHSNERT